MIAWTDDPLEPALGCAECDGRGYYTVDLFGDGPDRYRHHRTEDRECRYCDGTGRRWCDHCRRWRADVAVDGDPFCARCARQLADDRVWGDGDSLPVRFASRLMEILAGLG